MEQIKKNQSSVEWLVEQINHFIYFIPMNKWDEIRGVVQQAKAIHKDEVMDANSIGYRDGIMYANGEDWMYQNSEHYYEETFGGNK